VAVEFSVGDRDTGRREPADDRNFAADVRSGSAETGEPRGGLENALTTTVLIHFSGDVVSQDLSRVRHSVGHVGRRYRALGRPKKNWLHWSRLRCIQSGYVGNQEENFG